MSDWKAWHRGLPDPPGRAQFGLKLMRDALSESSRIYARGFLQSYGAAWNTVRGKKARKQRDDGEAVARQGEQAAKELAHALKETGEGGPAMLRRWLAPKMALFGESMKEFGAGFRQG